MNKKNALIKFMVLIGGLLWIMFSVVPPGGTTDGEIPAPHPGFLAPDFALQDFQGQTVTLSSLRGKAVVINFWASWCTPCKEEMPALQDVHLAYLSKDTIILAINATRQDSRQNALAFAEKNGLTFPILLDDTGEVNRLYAVHSLPTTFFIRPDGIIAEVVVGGPMQDALLRARIDDLFQEK